MTTDNDTISTVFLAPDDQRLRCPACNLQVFRDDPVVRTGTGKAERLVHLGCLTRA